MSRLAIVHAGWPKTATTTLQQQVRGVWPNLAGRPWNRPGGEACKTVLSELVRGRVDGPAIDQLFESSWKDRSLPVILSHEGLIGMRMWQHGRENYDSVDVPGHLAATTWPVRVVVTLRSPLELVRSNYRYAVRGGYSRSYVHFLEEERASLQNARGPFSIRAVIAAWEQSFGRECITVAWMGQLVRDPPSFWRDLAADTGVVELATIGDVPVQHLNPTKLGPLRWELAVNRVLAPKSGRRGSELTARVRRVYNRHVAERFAPGTPQLDGGELERAVVEPMQDDVTWLLERYRRRSST